MYPEKCLSRYAVGVLLIASIYMKTCYSLYFDGQLPCDFRDSVNITGGIRHPNKSISFDNTVFSFSEYATVHYVLNGKERVQTEPHIRGCPCKIRKCIRLCCPYGSFVKSTAEDYSIECSENEAAKNFEVQMLDTNNVNTIVNLDHYFGYVNIICSQYYMEVNFTLYRSGDLVSESKLYRQRDYCLKFSDPADNSQPSLEALICSDAFEAEQEHSVIYSKVPYGMMVSVPFIIATFIVYIFIREHNHFHGRCFMCFLFCLLLYFIMMAWAKLANPEKSYKRLTRISVASSIYFLFLSATLWLNVISCDVWHNLRSFHRNGIFPKRRQSYFNTIYVYVCGLPLTLVIIACILDSIRSCSSYKYCVQPGLGTDNFFLKEKPWIPKAVFLYLPLCAMFIANIVFFILTIRKIHDVERDPIFRHEPNRKFLNTKNNFILNAQLFNLLGFFSCVEFYARATLDRKCLLFTDIFNTFLGIIVFLLFVLNPRTQSLIVQRYQSVESINIRGNFAIQRFINYVNPLLK